MKVGRQRGWTKVDNTRIERLNRLYRRHRCFMTVDAFTLEPYCELHGRDAGWPCKVGHRSSLTQWPGVTPEQILERLR